MSDEIPPNLLKRHPELVAIGQAVEQHRRGEPVTATCIVCEQPLVVTEVAAVGALVVTCPSGHVNYRASRDRSRPSPRDE